MKNVKINEFFTESEFVMNTDSYCKKSVFQIICNKNEKYTIKTSVTLIESEDVSLIDAVSEIWNDKRWEHVTEIIPKQASVENLKKCQEDIILNTASIVFGLPKKDIDINANETSIYEWPEFESDSSEEGVISLDFRNKRT
tara:strand:- start:723 stop:1145 length:423 start_codon:yes stop_codon:yes gene_type:complete